MLGFVYDVQYVRGCRVWQKVDNDFERTAGKHMFIYIRMGWLRREVWQGGEIRQAWYVTLGGMEMVMTTINDTYWWNSVLWSM